MMMTMLNLVLNGTIDLGEIAAQYLSLNLEPYPRSVDCQDEQSLLKTEN